MTELAIDNLLDTQTVAIRDIVCDGQCWHKGPEECSGATYLVFPYCGVYMRHLGRDEAVAEANQVLFFNDSQSYRISHPVQGGDACLSIRVREDFLHELTPKEHFQDAEAVMFLRQRLRIDPRAQVLVALLRHSLSKRSIEILEAETLTLTLIRRALGERTSHVTRSGRAWHGPGIFQSQPFHRGLSPGVRTHAGSVSEFAPINRGDPTMSEKTCAACDYELDGAAIEVTVGGGTVEVCCEDCARALNEAYAQTPDN
jgi:hypothetical protein